MDSLPPGKGKGLPGGPPPGKGDWGGPRTGQVTFRTNFNNVVMDVMLSLGWVRVRDKGDPHENLSWDFNWCDVAWVHEMPSALALGSHARVCHFPTHYEVT